MASLGVAISTGGQREEREVMFIYYFCSRHTDVYAGRVDLRGELEVGGELWMKELVECEIPLWIGLTFSSIFGRAEALSFCWMKIMTNGNKNL